MRQRYGILATKRDHKLLNLAPLTLMIFLRFLRDMTVELKFLLSSDFVPGSLVSLRQSIVCHFERLIEFGTDFDRFLIGGNCSRKIRALRVDNPQLQIRGTKFRIKMHRLL